MTATIHIITNQGPKLIRMNMVKSRKKIVQFADVTYGRVLREYAHADKIHFPLTAVEGGWASLSLTGAVSTEGKTFGTAVNQVADPTCETCFFGMSELCSLPKGEACPTFRPQGVATKDP